MQILGNLHIPLEIFQEKFTQIKAFVSDWDGVFNNGIKNPSMPSAYSEADSMGTNLLRYEFWLRFGRLPVFGIITGADNPSAIDLAKREHFQIVYSKIVNKAEVVLHFCEIHQLHPQEVACFFDDVNDLAMARLCGLRFFFQRKASPAFGQLVADHQLADYTTAQEGGEHAIREICEMLMNLTGNYEKVIFSRANFDADYQNYFAQRQMLPTHLYRKNESKIELIEN